MESLTLAYNEVHLYVKTVFILRRLNDKKGNCNFSTRVDPIKSLKFTFPSYSTLRANINFELEQACQTRNTVRAAKDVLKPKKLSAGCTKKNFVLVFVSDAFLVKYL